MDNDFIVKPKMGRMVMLAFLSLVFVLIGLVFLFVQFDGDTVIPKVIGAITVIFFGLCMLYYIKVLMKPEPAVIVTKEGIIDQSSYIRAGLVRWEEIEGIDLISFSGQDYLGIFTFDPDLIIDRSSGFKKMLNRMNTGLLPSQVNIPVKLLNCSMDDLMNAISERWEAAIQNNTTVGQ
ncbi:STM3941 family protein [Lederbergia graminis]|uniref:STM3941 family protein n=1 Tax=Lederbergia graminis TaxID=735518 RepID=A0ABW0LHR8_9BACI|nr:STM3941 family protein [Paenibacillus bovis]